jgi:hypothetical protein
MKVYGSMLLHKWKRCPCYEKMTGTLLDAMMIPSKTKCQKFTSQTGIDPMTHAFEASVHPRFPDESDSPVSLVLKASFRSTAPLVPCYIGIGSQIWTRSWVRITPTVMRE